MKTPTPSRRFHGGEHPNDDEVVFVIIMMMMVIMVGNNRTPPGIAGGVFVLNPEAHPRLFRGGGCATVREGAVRAITARVPKLEGSTPYPELTFRLAHENGQVNRFAIPVAPPSRQMLGGRL